MKQNLSIITLLAGILLSGNTFSQTYHSTGSVFITPATTCPGIGAYSNSVINVTGTGTIGTVANVDINTRMDINCVAAFKLVLVAPNGDSCILLNMPHRFGPCDGNCYPTSSANTYTFNATNTTTFPAAVNPPTGNYAPTGSPYQPQVGNLSTFLAGKSINGTWTLAASGDASAGATVSSWSMVFGPTALPLDLLGFYGNAHPGYNQLQWTTASEKNTAFFEVQRSADGLTFQTAGKVKAVGSGSNVYRFEDKNHTSGMNIYRLRMTDNSGEYAYSKTVKIIGKTAKDAGFSFTPNPVKDVLNISVTNEALLHKEGNILNSLGQVVHTFSINQENATINIANLPAGVYYLRLNADNHYRFVKGN